MKNSSLPGGQHFNLGTVYKDAVSFAAASVSMRLHLSAPVRVRYQNRVILKRLSKIGRVKGKTASL